MKKTYSKNVMILFLTALIWGTGFVAQSAGAEHVPPFTFNCIRCILGGGILLIYLKGRDIRHKRVKEELPRNKKALLLGGILCGIILCAGMGLQQIGIAYTTVGKAGFLSGLYILMVPILGLFLKKHVEMKTWISVLIAAVGLYFLCITESFSLQKGDAYMLICAVFFAGHILVIDFFSPKVDGVCMSCIQFFVCGIISGVFMLLFETPSIEAIQNGWFSILYAGAMGCGIAYTLQIVGQKNMNPTVASLILSIEMVVSVLAGFLVFGERLTSRELIGCTLMFGAIILAQLPQKRRDYVA
jgi:Permeases of the drug/metabolite transporter (DMT) superfamily